MSKIQGRLGTLDVSSDGGATWVPVLGAQDISFTGNADELDVSAHDSGIFREYLQGRIDASIDFALWWDEDDPGQGIIKQSYFGALRFDVRFRMQVGSGKDEYKAKCWVTSFSPSSPNDDAASVDVTLRVTGNFTNTSQP